MILGNIMFQEEHVAHRRAMMGVFVLEDLQIKKALEENNIIVRRILGEREVKLYLPDDWSLWRTGRPDKRLHFICNPNMQPIFATFSAHLTEVPTKGWVKRVEDCTWLSGDNSIILGNKTTMRPVEVSEFIAAPNCYPYKGLHFWEKLPGVIFVCTADRKPIGELCAYYHETHIRRRRNEEEYTLGRVEEVEDVEEDYGPENTHRYTVKAEEFVNVGNFAFLQKSLAGLRGSLKQICISSIAGDERLVRIYSEPGRLPLALKKDIDIHILSENIGKDDLRRGR